MFEVQPVRTPCKKPFPSLNRPQQIPCDFIVEDASTTPDSKPPIAQPLSSRVRLCVFCLEQVGERGAPYCLQLTARRNELPEERFWCAHQQPRSACQNSKPCQLRNAPFPHAPAEKNVSIGLATPFGACWCTYSARLKTNMSVEPLVSARLFVL